VLSDGAPSTHADFFVVVATAIPVLYVVLGVIFARLFGPKVTAGPFFRRWYWSFAGAIYAAAPLSSVALAAFALMTESDSSWIRWWCFAGLVVVLYLTFVSVGAAMYRPQGARSRPLPPEP
jgi:hypothetical protein